MTNSAANHIELSGVAVRTAVHAEGACKNVLAAIKKLGHLQISNVWISYCLAYLAFGMGLQTGVWNSSLDCRQLHTVFIQWFQRKLVPLLGRLRFSIVSSFHRWWSRETQQRDTWCAQYSAWRRCRWPALQWADLEVQLLEWDVGSLRWFCGEHAVRATLVERRTW